MILMISMLTFLFSGEKRWRRAPLALPSRQPSCQGEDNLAPNMSRDPSPTTLSDEEDDVISENNSSPRGEMKGKLQKWTNYIHGWQERYVVLRDGVMAYYKSEHDLSFIRGSISILKANIKVYNG